MTMKKKIIFLTFLNLYAAMLFSQCILNITHTDATCDDKGSATVVPDKKTCTPPFTYLWTGPNGYTSTSASTTGMCPGNYNVVVTQGGGATVSGNVTIGIDFTGSTFPLVPTNNQGGNEVIKDICVSQDDGAIYVIGYFTKDIFYGTNYELTNNTNYRAIFVAKYDRCGILQNAVQYGYADNDETNLHIEMLSNGLLAIAGDFDNTISFDGGSTNYNTQGGTDVFLAIISPTTLYVTSSNNVRHMYSANNDRAKGLSHAGNCVAITGSFAGTSFTGGGSTLTIHNSNYTDLFVGRFDYTSSLQNVWIRNYYYYAPLYWDDRGMATAYLDDGQNAYIYFTFKMSYNNYPRSYIAYLNASNGNNLGFYQFNLQSGDFHEIMDMKVYDNDLYLCGQYYLNSTPNEKDALIYYYDNPNTNGLSGGPTEYVISVGQSGNRNCIANRLIVNGNGVYTIGTFNQDDYRFTGVSGVDPYGTSHFAARLTHATLDQDWITGIENSGTSGVSYGNGFDMDECYGVYYVGGTFTGTVNLNTNGSPNSMTATSSYDAYVARFLDNGEADYRKKPAQFINEQPRLEIVYPNPACDIVNIYAGGDYSQADITFTDMFGRIVFKNICTVNETGNIVINTSSLPANTYFISVETGSEVTKYKLILVK